MNASLRHWLPLAVLLLGAAVARGQGEVWFNNSGARTRMGTTDGPLADGNILAQMLLGLNSNSLSPVGVPRVHLQGLVIGGTVIVPDIPGLTDVYMQMAAWNAQLWGSLLADVPVNQIGWTDTISVFLVWPFDPASRPFFNQPAIVPVPVPEPAAWALGVLGTLMLLTLLRPRRTS